MGLQRVGGARCWTVGPLGPGFLRNFLIFSRHSSVQHWFSFVVAVLFFFSLPLGFFFFALFVRLPARELCCIGGGGRVQG